MQTTNPATGFPTSGANGSEGTLNSAAGSAHDAVDRAASAAQGKIKPVIDRVASSAHQVVDKAVSVATPTAEWLSERGQTLKETQDRMLTDAREYVTSNPMKAVGIALAAGVVIGRLMR